MIRDQLQADHENEKIGPKRQRHMPADITTVRREAATTPPTTRLGKAGSIARLIG
jgi:hypothetical protein